MRTTENVIIVITLHVVVKLKLSFCSPNKLMIIIRVWSVFGRVHSRHIRCRWSTAARVTSTKAIRRGALVTAFRQISPARNLWPGNWFAYIRYHWTFAEWDTLASL